MPAHRRHDISDGVWDILDPIFPGEKVNGGDDAR